MAPTVVDMARTSVLVSHAADPRSRAIYLQELSSCRKYDFSLI